MESEGTGTKHLGSQSARSLGWISLRGEWRLSCKPLSEITKLSVELVKYARKKGCTQKSDNRERQSFFRLQALVCMKYQVTMPPRYHLLIFKFCIIAKVGSSLIMDYTR